MANISFRSLLGLLFGIQSWLYAQGQVISKHALIDQQVHLTCYLNSTEDVTWNYGLDGTAFSDIYICKDNQNGRCAITTTGLILNNTGFNMQATRSNDRVTLSLTLPASNVREHNFKCELGNNILQKFSVKSIELNTIIANCTVKSPRSDENGVGSLTLSCEVNSGELDVNLTLEGIGLNILDNDPGSSQSIKAKTLYFDDFDNVLNASCNAYFSDVDVIRSCTYPNIIKVQYIFEGNDIIVECDNESDVDHWRFYGSDGIEEDIEDRSWIREGGRSLLIRNVSERDVGKVVMCQNKGDGNNTSKGTIGFTVISEISGDINNSNSEGPAAPPSARDPYLVLTLLFLTLWLITTAVGGVCLACKPKRNESRTSAIASASGNAPVPNGGSERETPLLNVGMGARGDPDTSNTNNSAHIPVFEPEVNSADENNRNRQSNNESHLYFTLEKSSPSPMKSLPRASTARWEHHDANPVSLNQPQRSHWQGYETVGEPNKGAASSFDLGEYAEVGKHFHGKGPPDIGEYAEVGKHFQGKGPPDLGKYAEVGKHSQGKWPPDLSGRPAISRLYSNVNK